MKVALIKGELYKVLALFEGSVYLAEYEDEGNNLCLKLNIWENEIKFFGGLK